MSNRSVVVVAAVLWVGMTGTGTAAEPGVAGGPLVRARAADLAPTPTALAAAALPADPILGGAQGATDSGAANILWGAVYGGLAGGVVGLGIALIENGNWARDIAIGAGVGIVIGAGLGAAHVFGDRGGPVRDGLGSTDRDPVIQGRTVGLAGRF